MISRYPIITGDKDLLNAKNITAINPAQAIKYLLKIRVITENELEEIMEIHENYNA